MKSSVVRSLGLVWVTLTLAGLGGPRAFIAAATAASLPRPTSSPASVALLTLTATELRQQLSFDTDGPHLLVVKAPIAAEMPQPMSLPAEGNRTADKLAKRAGQLKLGAEDMTDERLAR
ncbi:hypothetical protein [Levilactobacillus paucivorans]|uniref:hypothetical protein n=1 Tax=Levilactobacillus paucivorans TaxID=616990 RepID=UPI00070A81D2|nr:hypothetical protein [Levilactobacillus paucivorans]